ncbi:MAG: DUF3558 family protein [Candidatus Limnocylindrales bacterium]
MIVSFLMLAACAGQTPATNLPSNAGATAVAPTAPAGTVAPPAQGFDACSIVTTAEVQAAIGSAVTTESGAGTGGQTICTFRTADGEGVLYTSFDPAGQVAFDASKTSAGAQVVPGLGDEAIFEPTIGLMVRSGTATMQFYPLTDISEEEALALALRLAQTASGRF